MAVKAQRRLVVVVVEELLGVVAPLGGGGVRAGYSSPENTFLVVDGDGT